MTPAPAPGPYFYTDTMPGAEAVRVELVDDDGTPVACFPADQGDEGAVIAVADLAGTLTPAR